MSFVPKTHFIDKRYLRDGEFPLCGVSVRYTKLRTSNADLVTCLRCKVALVRLVTRKLKPAEPEECHFEKAAKAFRELSLALSKPLRLP